MLKINARFKLNEPCEIQVLSCANYKSRVYTRTSMLTCCRVVPYFWLMISAVHVIKPKVEIKLLSIILCQNSTLVFSVPKSFPSSLTFYIDPYSLLNFKILVCLLFMYAFNHIIYLLLPSRCLKTLPSPTLLVFTGAC